MTDELDHKVRSTMERWLSEPFEVGRNDCGLLAIRCAYAVTGRDDLRELGRAIQGRYQDEARGMHAAMKSLGIKRIYDHPLVALADHFFPNRCAPLQCRRWDLAIGRWARDEALTLGVVEGHRIVVISETGGLMRVRLSSAEIGWRVE